LHPVLAQIHITQHCWLYAHTMAMAGLVVYRSPLLRDTDKIYQPVAKFLREHPMRMVLRESIPDQSMMFGRGDLTVFRPSGGHYPDSDGPALMKKLKATVGGN
jgi:hypothetical protein